MKIWHVLVVAAIALAAPAAAQERVTLGWGRIFDNDALGDGHDRWQSGSYIISLIRGPRFSGLLPDRIGTLLEWRLRSQIAAPANLADPVPGDRRYAGILGLGLHSQARWQGGEVALGADLVAVGPQTGISDLQAWVHQALSIDEPDTSGQIGNRLIPHLSAEIARDYDLGPLRLRPFLAGEAGVETLARAGPDLTFGDFGRGAVMVSDTVTGQRYRAAQSQISPGVSLVAGGDVAGVLASTLLDDPEPSRGRLRLGLQWQGQRAAMFYGLTRLTPEFRGQSSGQTLGSRSLNLQF